MQLSTPQRFARALLAPLTVALLLAAGCSDDDKSSNPDDPNVLEVPSEMSLADALDQVGPGEEIRVAPGTYSMTGTLTISSKLAEVTLRGSDGGDRPILDFSTANAPIGVLISEGADEFVLDNFELVGPFTIGVNVRANDVVVSRCRIDDAGTLSVSASTPIEGLRVEDNILFNPGLFGVSLTNGANAEVTGNTIANARDCGIYTVDSAPVCRQNLIIHSANFGIACFGSVVPTLSCNLIYDSVTADYSAACEPGDDDITGADPLLWNETTYELQPESPCAAENSAGCGLIGAMDVSMTDPSDG